MTDHDRGDGAAFSGEKDKPQVDGDRHQREDEDDQVIEVLR